jgi:hypothetical protein
MDDFVPPYRAGKLKGKPMANGRWFEETKHYVGGGFWRYWNERGGLPVFGYPLTDEFEEHGHTVQYFERARFEWQPDKADNEWGVVLGLVGKEAFEKIYGKKD